MRAARCAWSTSGEADVASPSGGDRRDPDAAADGATPARAAEGRRACDCTARRDHGGQAHERAHPLCHPLPLSNIEVSLEVREDSVEITAVVETTAQTGVEMEALTAASLAALTVYDMCKAVDKAMTIGELRLIEKTKEQV